jgi:hypothetical protein
LSSRKKVNTHEETPPSAFHLASKAAFVHAAQASAKFCHELGGFLRRWEVLIVIMATDIQNYVARHHWVKNVSIHL